MITVKELLDIINKPMFLSLNDLFKPLNFIIQHTGQRKYELCAPVMRVSKDNNKYCYINNCCYYDSPIISYDEFTNIIHECDESYEVVFEVLDKQQGRIFNTSDANIDSIEISSQPMYITIVIKVKD